MTKYLEKKLSGGVVGHFIDNDEAIYTQQIPNGLYLACRYSGGRSEGVGKTRIAAVIDLIENVSGFDAGFIYDTTAFRVNV